MITITQGRVWVRCKACNSWANLAEHELVILYSFENAPLLNWVFYDCCVCDEDIHFFLIGFVDPVRLLAVLRDYPSVAEAAMQDPGDMDICLYVTEFNNRLQLADTPSDMFG
jgi:hypothetical protein